MGDFYYVGDNNNNAHNNINNYQNNGQIYYDNNNTNINNVGNDYYLDPTGEFFMNTNNNDYQMIDNNVFDYATNDFNNTTGDIFEEDPSAQLMSDLNRAISSPPTNVARQARESGDDLTAPEMLGKTSFFSDATNFDNADGDADDDDDDFSSLPALETEVQRYEDREVTMDAEIQSDGEEDDEEEGDEDGDDEGEEEGDEGSDEETDAMTDSEAEEDAQDGAAMLKEEGSENGEEQENRLSNGRVHDGRNGYDGRTYHVESGEQDIDMMHSPGASTPAASEHSSENEDVGNDLLLSTLLPVDEINKSQRADKALHEKAKALIPHSMAPNRYWIAVLNHNLLPKEVKKEKDFLWIKGNRKHTVQTIWHTYQNATAAEDSFQLWTHDEMPDLDDIMEELDFYSDKLVVFQARLPSRLANKGLKEAPIEIDDD